MGKRLNDIVLSLDQKRQLALDIEEAFRSHIQTTQKFTGTRSLRIYTLLQGDIHTFGGEHIGTNTLCQIMTGKHRRSITTQIYGALIKYIDAFTKLVKSPELIGGQRVFWGPNQGLDPGAFIETMDGDFIPWNQLKSELESRVISQCPRIIPEGSSVVMKSFYGKENWVINILNPARKSIGSVWIGGNPTKNWEQDGFIRIGKSVSDTEWIVYQMLARFPDGSYRIQKSFV